MAYNVNTVKIEGQEEFKQEPIPELPPTPLNIETVPQGSTLRDGDFFSPSFRESRAGWRLRSNGDAEFNNATIRGTIIIGGQYRTVAVGDSIQDAIDAVNSAGGGVVILKNGTHTLTSDITLYSKITLQGQNGDSTFVDFNSGAYQIKAIGSGAYTTGTVSISNNGTTVTGSGTVWSTNVTAGQYILLSGIWYPITNVGGDTTLTIGLPYADIALSGATYTIATILSNVKIYNLTVKNSTTSAIKFKYVNNLFMDDVSCQSSLTGLEFDTCSQITADNLDMIANYYNYSFTNTHFMTSNGCSSVDALVGSGYTLNTVTNTAISASFILNSASDGMNFTDCSNMRVDVVTAENTGSGIEFVSGNNNIIFGPARVESNASDGIKLTASSDNIFVSNSFIKNNTGYGINNVASSNDNFVITGNNFSGNSTSAVNDSGTGTVIRGNVGVDDNSTGVGARFDVQTFTSSGTWTKPTGISGDALVTVQLWGAGGSGAKSQSGGNACGGGGGGEFIEYQFKASDLTGTVSVTIGSGGTTISTNNTNGVDGGDSTFGSYITAKGGKGGITNSPANDGTGGDGGSPFGTTTGLWGMGGAEATGSSGLYSAGGGGATVASTAYPGGDSRYGGAGGAGVSSTNTSSGGVSVFGGNGGASSNTGTATSGAQPAGGGGACASSGNSGAGGSGKAIVRTIY